MNRRSFLLGAASAVFAPWAASAGMLHQDGAEWFSNVEVTAQDGRTFRFYDDLLKDKIILVNFFFAGCDALCPLMTQNLASVQDLLGARVNKDIFFYSITLQPLLDTPEILAAYAKSHGAGPGWLFLTGQPDNIELLRHRLGFVESNPAEDADLEAHIGTIRIANVPMHRWTMTPGLLNPSAIVHAVKSVIPED